MDDSSKQHVPEPWARQDAPLLAPARRVARAVVPRNVRFDLYFRILETPVLSELYTLGRGRLRHRRVRASTRVVIEGFPSSGNTFARQAFLLANPRVSPDDICSHTHSPRVVVKGVRLGVPCIVLARDPRDAVSSTVQRFTGIHLTSAFSYYERYYRKLLPFRDRFVVAPFTVAISDFPAILEQCNDKYGVDFVNNPRADVSGDAVIKSIEDRSRARHDGSIVEERISRPSSKRLKAAEFLTDLDADEQRARDRALAAYHEFIAGAPLPA